MGTLTYRPIDRAIVRIYDADGHAPGVGFLVDERHLVTCAHVVNVALGGDTDDVDESAPTARVRVDFPLLDRAPGDDPPEGIARVVAWVPPGSGATGSGDIAGLRLTTPPPAGTEPCDFTDPNSSVNDVSARAFGFPADRPDGGWQPCTLRGRNAARLQLDNDSAGVFRLQPGFSGSPIVLDEDGTVVGMLSAAAVKPEDRDAYGIALDELIDAWRVIAARTVPDCPYPGLVPFTEDNAHLFFGRDKTVVRLAKRLRQVPQLMLLGASGSGKSSLLAAGLIPALREAGDWHVIWFRPRRDPFGELAGAFEHSRHGRMTPGAPTSWTSASNGVPIGRCR